MNEYRPAALVIARRTVGPPVSVTSAPPRGVPSELVIRPVMVAGAAVGADEFRVQGENCVTALLSLQFAVVSKAVAVFFSQLLPLKRHKLSVAPSALLPRSASR